MPFVKCQMPRATQAAVMGALLLLSGSCNRSESAGGLKVPGAQVKPIAVRKPFDAASAGSEWAGLNGLAVRGGKIVVADPQAPGLFVFDSLQATPRRLGVKGDGPAELRRPRSLVWTSDSTVLVHDYQRVVALEWNVLSGRAVRQLDLRGRPSMFRFVGRLILGADAQVIAAPWEEALVRDIPPGEIGAPVLLKLRWAKGAELLGWGRTAYAPGSSSGVLASAWERGDAFVLGDTLHRLRARDGVIELYDLRLPSPTPVVTRSLRGFFAPREPADLSRPRPDGRMQANVRFDPLFESATRLKDGRYVVVAHTRESQTPSEGRWPEQVLAVYAPDGGFIWGGRLPGGVHRWLQAAGDTVYVLGFNRRDMGESERALQVFVLPPQSRAVADK